MTNKFRHPYIDRAFKEYDSAREIYYARVESVQRECRHDVIIERRGYSTKYQYIENTWNLAVRACAICGYVEEARCWPTNETTTTPLYNTKPKSKSILNRVDFEIKPNELDRYLIRRP